LSQDAQGEYSCIPNNSTLADSHTHVDSKTRSTIQSSTNGENFHPLPRADKVGELIRGT
jgi:hypothetical protein